MGKLVIENYLRSLAFGAKYIFQTLPRVLTLWVDLGSEPEQAVDPKYSNEELVLLAVAEMKVADSVEKGAPTGDQKAAAFNAWGRS